MRPATHYLAAGLRSAGRRFHCVLLDMVFKGAFGTIALTVVVLSFLAFLARVPVDEETGAAFAVLPSLAALAAVPALVENGSLLAQSLIGAALFTMLIWTVTEAFVRGGLLPETGNTPIRAAFAHFPLFLWTGALRRCVLLSAGIVIGLITLGPLLTAPVEEWGSRWPDVRWPVVAGVILLAWLAFFLVMLDTLSRCDALELLGTSLPAVVWIVGFPMLLEVSMWSLAGAATLAAARAPVLALGVGGACLVGLSAGHSYLLLARYSAIGIMRRDP